MLGALAKGTRTPPYKIMLVAAALLWGGSFVILKDTLDIIAPSWLLGIRFVLAGCVMTVAFLPRIRASLDGGHVRAAVALGVTGGMGYLVQNLGLVDTTPGHNAFLTATYCVMVPFIHWIVKRVRPPLANLTAAVVAVAGIGVLSLGGDDPFSLRWGDWMTLGGAVWYAIQIEIMATVAKGRDIVALTAVEFFVMGALCLAYGAVFETAPSVAVLTNPELWRAMAYLVVFCSCVCFLFQNVGQAHVPPAQASLLLSLESVFGVMFSVLLYGEELTVQLALGFALVFGAVLLSECAPKRVAAVEGGR